MALDHQTLVKLDATNLSYGDRLRCLASIVEQLEPVPNRVANGSPGQLDQRTYSFRCGSPACALGWTAAAFEGWEVDGLGRPNFLGCHDPIESAKTFFGVDGTEESTLFGPMPRIPEEQALLLREIADAVDAREKRRCSRIRE